MIYLDNAATTNPKPAAVKQAMLRAMTVFSANPGRSGHRLSLAAAEAVYSVREKAAHFFGAENPAQVVFTAGCTASVNQVLKGVLQQGDHVIVSDLEHNAVMRPLATTGMDYTAFTVAETDAETLQNLADCLQPNTKMVFITGASNVTGKRLPVAKIGAFCRKHQLLFGVDAAQVAGVTDLQMKRDGIDYLCVAPHKGLYGPMGIGLLVARQPISRALVQGGTGTDSADLLQPDTLPEALESGTPNLPGIFGTSAGMDFVLQRGIAKIASHELFLTERLYAALSRLPHILLYAPPPQAEASVGVLSFNVRDISAADVASYLNQNGIAVRAGLHCAPSAHQKIGTLPHGTVRVAFSAFSNAGQVERLVELLRDSRNLLKK